MSQENVYHRLLGRQIRRFVPPELESTLGPFFQSISEFYESADKERRLLEHTLDVSSKELEEANKAIRRQHEEIHNSILNALSVGLFAIDLHGKIIFANDSAHYLFGKTTGSLIGCDLSQFIQDEEISDIIENGVGFGRREGETQLYDQYNSVILIHYSAYPIMNDKQTIGTVFSFSDVTIEHKREELIDLQQLALESTSSMMLITDHDGYIQYANKEFVRVSGYSVDELIGEDSHFIIDESINGGKIVHECWGRVSNGLTWEGEILAKTKSGDVYFEELSLTPLIQRGKITHYVAVKKDISERIRAQEELKYARDEAIMAMNQAKEANRAKDTFLSNMSHELRTPLNAINGFSQILIAKPDTPASAKKFIEKILIAGNSLLSLVNTILDFAKIEAGKMEVHKTPFLMSDLVGEVAVLVEPMGQNKHLHLHLEIQEGILVQADRQLIKQVFVNLLSNAIKFSPEGEQIELLFEIEEERYVFGISDHGHGIPEDKIDSLFDPFVQIREHQSDAIKGTGLGLSIVKKIIELHDGEIWVKSELGIGSCFYFSLPKVTLANR